MALSSIRAATLAISGPTRKALVISLATLATSFAQDTRSLLSEDERDHCHDTSPKDRLGQKEDDETHDEKQCHDVLPFVSLLSDSMNA